MPPIWLILSLSLILFRSALSLSLTSKSRSDSTSPAAIFGLDIAAVESRQTDGSPGQEEYRCSPGTPCKNGACCGVSGWCGYSPTYCGDGCTSNCDAKAECGQYSATGDATCPLNVCCSQFGFCGTTDGFCGTGCQSNCGAPSRPAGKGGDVRDNVFGYYESWKSSGSECGVLDPSQLPVEALKAVNFAFAYITPVTYEIVPMPGEDFNLITKVANAKMRSPDTKMWVSIGGWSFNDNGTSTQPVFSDIASSLLKQAAFANKLAQFMSQYGFDGVDLDWEYPGAPDRGGQSTTDIKNYVNLLQIIKSKFNVEKRAWGISITVPTSYWYLRWFDLPGLASYVDFFNLMAYDLHGTWDSNDPIGPYAYAHTNLTEIDLALDLFWRENIEPSKVNLGLAFYGRSFELADPSCTTPGCLFKGPGAQGPCTQTAGILSYREIQNILNDANIPSFSKYDADAAVNYLIYNQTSWVSYDDRTTFQRKIDFANNRGLRGLFIWAIDQDTDDFAALKAVTGKDIAPSIKESDTLGNWDVSQCWITPCGTDCQQGFVKMAGLNLDRNGNGCPKSNKNSKQRSLCCPPWGAPDPSTCHWYGHDPECFGQCEPNQVLLADDNFAGGGWCRNGRKAFCCPATGGSAAVAACEWHSGKSCPSNLPQAMTTVGATLHKTFCCPDAPKFNNCGWHGDDVTCNNNRCKVGQIELARSSDAGWSCVLGRQKAYCCDPPFGGTAFVPVPLEDLFPDKLPSDAEPVYYEAFDRGGDMNPSYNSVYTDDPEGEPFSWIIMVGAQEDVQSLRRRDGSQLVTFDCPTPEPGDFSTQTLRAVCMAEDYENNNCEEMMLGSVRGTIARLPEDCGPDEWVRVVSFRAVRDFTVPGHLLKRAPQNATVYEIKYDYNLRHLRRDGGEVYVRVDASDHPGYWDKVVSSVTSTSKRSYEPHEWRDFHLAWFEKHGYIQANDSDDSGSTTGGPRKRGFGSASWWSDAFKSLLTSGAGYGFHKKYSFSQVLYSASKTCPGALDAGVEARVEGTFETRLDYGISLIGTLKNFNFEEAYAYFSMSKMEADGRGIVEAHAAFQIQSQKLPILDHLDPFGGSFNIKGLVEVGPYVDITAQLLASITASGTVTAGIRLGAQEFTWMYPQSLNTWPASDQMEPFPSYNAPQAGSEVAIASEGSLTVSLTPAMGFQIIMAYGGSSLVNTEIKATMQTDIIWYAGAAASSGSCNGAYYAIGGGLGVTISLTNPLPGWDTGPKSYSVYDYTTVTLAPFTCYEWNSSSSASTRREIDQDLGRLPTESSRLSARALTDSLFPDSIGSLMSCPTDFYTDTGDCNVEVGDYTGDYDDDSSGTQARGLAETEWVARRDDAPLNHTLHASSGSSKTPHKTGNASHQHAHELAHQLSKRTSSKKAFDICTDDKQRNQPKSYIKKFGPNKLSFPSSGDMINKKNGYKQDSFVTYGPLKPDDCDDYSFGVVSTPPGSQSDQFASEHALEWQILKRFLQESPNIAPLSETKVANPSAKNFLGGVLLPKDPNDPNAKDGGEAIWTYCSYLWFWWGPKTPDPKMTYDGLTSYPIDIVNKAFPNTAKHQAELTLLSKEANNLKERLWGRGQIRDDSKMQKYITGTTATSNVNLAINNCKQIMFAIKYMQIPDIATLLATQAKRVGTYFDDIETKLAAMVSTYPSALLITSTLSSKTPKYLPIYHKYISQPKLTPRTKKQPTSDTYNAATYQKLNIGDAWRKYVYAEYAQANAKQADFLKTWVARIADAHLGGDAGGDSNDAGGGQQAGGKQTNPAVVKRVEALQAAYEDFLKTPWTNPFPADWA